MVKSVTRHTSKRKKTPNEGTMRLQVNIGGKTIQAKSFREADRKVKQNPKWKGKKFSYKVAPGSIKLHEVGGVGIKSAKLQVVPVGQGATAKPRPTGNGTTTTTNNRRKK
jgi:hypothetical protein